MASGEQTREGLTTFSSGATSLRLTHWLTAAAVLAVTLVALYVRAMTARDLLPQIDEPATLLAIEMVASKGVPLLPSGVLYLQGALISYLAAPIAWVTDADGLLDTVRFINLLISLAVPLLTMAITHRLTHSRGASVVAGLLAALDPNLIVWGILIRPYGLLTVESLVLVYVFVVLLQEGAQARIGPLRAITWLVLIAFLGTFTHIGIWLLFPPLALVALLVWQRGLFGPQRPVLVATLVSLLAPILFLILSNRVGIGSSTTPGAESSGFIGSHLFDLQRMLDEPISLSIWLRNFYESVFSNVFPFLIAILSGVIIGAHLRGRDQQGESRGDGKRVLRGRRRVLDSGSGRLRRGDLRSDAALPQSRLALGVRDHRCRLLGSLAIGFGHATLFPRRAPADRGRGRACAIHNQCRPDR